MTLLYNLIFIILSWLVIYRIDRKSIFRLWLQPWSRRRKEFLQGFFFLAGLCILGQVVFSLLNGTSWSISQDLKAEKFLDSLYFDINSVLFEELLFRGLILHLLIKYLNKNRAIIISSIAFGIYHWFTMGVLGNMMGMAVVFLVTASMGYALASAYATTRSLLLPISLHLGWNLTNHNIFSQGPLGTMFLEASKASASTPTAQWGAFLTYLIVSLLTLLFVRFNYKAIP